MRMNKGQPFMDVQAYDESAPTFSEAFLYERVGKGDARFILGVAEEYEHIVAALGPRAVTRLLDVKPRLAQRLGVGDQVAEALEDAVSDELLTRQIDVPPEVRLDYGSARAAWWKLHESYRSFFDPEHDMDRNELRAYNALTEALGSNTIRMRAAEQARAAEKLKTKRERKALTAVRAALSARLREEQRPPTLDELESVNGSVDVSEGKRPDVHHVMYRLRKPNGEMARAVSYHSKDRIVVMDQGDDAQ